MFLFYLFIILYNFFFYKGEKLIFVESFFRHGARAPIKLNDDGLDVLGVKWSTPGELTPIGKRMEYILGLYNRKRYITGKNKFLSEKFDPHELIVYSSDLNRTLLSATSLIQGLYPMSPDMGDKLTPEQFNISFPPLNISYEDYTEELNLLNDSALPNYMTVIPIHVISLKNTTKECEEKVKDINNNNSKNKKIISDFIENFNKNYSEILNSFYGRPKDTFLDFTFINAFFDGLVADLTEGNDVSQFFRMNNLNINEFLEKRYDVIASYFRDYIFGDDDSQVVLFFNTPLLKNMLNYMKRKIEDDINGYPSLKNVSDYSRPKMVLISSHDTTLSAIEMFFIKYFELGIESYKYPIYTSQINFEITREEDDIIIKEKNSVKNLKYSDYKVSYYFNGKVILNITFDKFVEKIENAVWNNERMDRFCFGDKKEKEKLEGSLIIIMLMGIIILILAVTLIFLITKLKKKSDEEFDENFKDNKLINDDKEE